MQLPAAPPEVNDSNALAEPKTHAMHTQGGGRGGVSGRPGAKPAGALSRAADAQAATGEDVSAEELGGAQLHCSTSGVTDHLAETEEHAISIARSIVANLGAAAGPSSQAAPGRPSTSWAEPLHPPEDLRGVWGRHCVLAWLMQRTRVTAASDHCALPGKVVVLFLVRIAWHCIAPTSLASVATALLWAQAMSI